MSRIRFALRTLAKSPLLSLVVILSLGLGIGVSLPPSFPCSTPEVNRSVRSLSPIQSSLVLHHLARQPPRTAAHSDNDSGDSDYIFNWRTFRELEKHTGNRHRPPPSAPCPANRLLPPDRARRHDALGLRSLFSQPSASSPSPAVTTIAPTDDISGGGNAVATVVGYRYWQDKLGADPQVLNQTIKVNGQSFTVAGIAPSQLHGHHRRHRPQRLPAHVLQAPSHRRLERHRQARRLLDLPARPPEARRDHSLKPKPRSTARFTESWRR